MVRVAKSKFGRVVYLSEEDAERLSAVLQDHKNTNYHEVHPDALAVIHTLIEGLENGR